MARMILKSEELSNAVVIWDPDNKDHAVISSTLYVSPEDAR